MIIIQIKYESAATRLNYLNYHKPIAVYPHFLHKKLDIESEYKSIDRRDGAVSWSASYALCSKGEQTILISDNTLIMPPYNNSDVHRRRYIIFYARSIVCRMCGQAD
jgi:hypothetical protein